MEDNDLDYLEKTKELFIVRGSAYKKTVAIINVSDLKGDEKNHHDCVVFLITFATIHFSLNQVKTHTKM